MAVAEMAPDLIWAPYFFWPQEIWASKNLFPDKYGLQEICSPVKKFSGTKFPGVHISRAQMRSGTILALITVKLL